MATPLGSAPGIIVGVGVGAAASTALEAAIELPRQKIWKDNPNRIHDPALYARLYAQGALALNDGRAFALREGYTAEKFDQLAYLAQTVPAVAESLTLWRRGHISDDLFTHVLTKNGLDARYITPILQNAYDERLDPAQTAAAIHRGLIPDPGLLRGEQPSGPRKVESYPVYPIPALEEAATHGLDRDHLGVLVGLQGLPMGVIEAAQAYYRGIITHGDYIAAFNESNNRNEWAEAVLEYAQQIPTARDFFENALRGYHDLAWAQDQAKRHGMSPEDSLVIYQNQGRPMNIRQITQALSRGAKFNPEPGELSDPYDASVVEGNIKPAYYELAKALKYTLPSPFVMRQLTESGVWSEAKCAQRLKDIGWIPEDADEAAAAWAGGGAGTTDPWLKRAQSQFWTSTHNSFVNGLTAGSEARDNLAQLGITGDTANEIVQLWTFERDSFRKQLTPSQIKKAWSKAVENPATNAPWTEQDAIDRLIALGWNFNDASTFLKE